MINDTTNLIFHFGNADAEVSAVSLGRLVGALEKLALHSGRHMGVKRVTFFHVASPVRGSLKFCFRVAVEGEVNFRASSTGGKRASAARPMEAIGTIAGVGALLAALFAPDGMYDVFHNGAHPKRELRSALSGPRDGISAPPPSKEDLERCLVEVRNAAGKCGAERVEIELPDFAPIQLSPVLAKGPLGKTSTLTGPWKIQITTPMGARTMRVYINQTGDQFTGEVSSEMGTQTIAGTIEGDIIKWATDITNPMPMKLEFEAKVSGNFMHGNCKLGMFGNAALSGEREFAVPA